MALKIATPLAPKPVVESIAEEKQEKILLPINEPVVASPIVAVAEELISLEAKLVELEVPEMLKRKDELKKRLVEHVGELGIDETLQWSHAGKNGMVIVEKAPSKYQLVDKGALLNTLGPQAFQEMATFSITDLKKVLSTNQLTSMGAYSYGSRSVKIGVKQ
jgi:hypothetical protein